MNIIFAAVTNQIQRYFLEFAYKGTHYHGWQAQINANTVQEELENALALLLGLPTPVMGSGRTDTGVHASQQYLHFDSEKELVPEIFLRKLNAILPPDIAAYQLKKVQQGAHARFDALWRSYEYHIHLRKNPFKQDASWQYFQKLDVVAMNKAAEKLLDYEDFECFSKVKTDVKTFHCKIRSAFWEQKEHELVFHITANRFLRGMVRAIVGTLIEVGQGKQVPEYIIQVIESKNRGKAGKSVPPQGLYLSEVVYPENIFI
jgi:tRNA pseudouridine38-40 synthase